MLHKDLHVFPKRVSATGGIYWLDDAKEVPDTQSVTYDYGNLMLQFELRSFAVDGTLHALEGRTRGSDTHTAFYGTDATMLIGSTAGRSIARTAPWPPKRNPAAKRMSATSSIA